MEEFPLEYSKSFTKAFGLLEKSNIKFFDDKKSTFFQRNWRFVFIILNIFGFSLSLTVYFVNLISNGDDYVEIALRFPIYFIVLQGIFKGSIVVVKKHHIRHLIEELAKLWPNDKYLKVDQIKKKHLLLKKLNLCHTLFFWINKVGCWQYILTPLLETLFRKIVLQQENTEMLLPFGCSFPFDPTENWFQYLLIYTFESYSVLKIINCLLGPELLMINFCAHLTTLFTILSDDLLTVNLISTDSNISFENETKNTNDIDIKTVVKRHQTLIRLSNMTDDIFNKIIFIDLIFATITICFFALMTKVLRSPGDVARNLIGVVATAVPIFNLCYYGQLLIDASGGLADSAYFNVWYDSGIKNQRILRFIILRSQTPCLLTSWRYAPVDLRTFSTVLSTTWSYFSLASSVYEDDGK